MRRSPSKIFNGIADSLGTTKAAGGWTVSHARSASRGQLSYLRLLATAKHAILDFCTQHAAAAIDVTGFDANSVKLQQKTRIYSAALSKSVADLYAVGYAIRQRAGILWHARYTEADASWHTGC